MKQQLLRKDFKISYEFGGDLNKGKRKTARPITTKKPMHLVFRSDYAKGELSLLRHEKLIKTVLTKQSKRFYIKIYNLAINSNHLHFCTYAKTRQGFKNFLRAFSGELAKSLLKRTKKKTENFWTKVVYSRIIEWGRALKIVNYYINQNTLEARGLIPYTPRKRQKKKSVGRPSVSHPSG